MRSRLVDNTRSDSLATRFRRRRFQFFLRLLNQLHPPIRLLDVGGSESFWIMMAPWLGENVSITLLNIDAAPVLRTGMTLVVGDARCMEFADHSFDVAFSNSVIEHVGSRDDQLKMAREIMRVSPRYFVQTPNRGFPLEPHFLVPWFQFWPMSARVWLLQRTKLGWYSKTPDRHRALEAAESIHLLNRSEFAALFPGSKLWEERVLGLVKSYVAYGGWDGTAL